MAHLMPAWSMYGALPMTHAAGGMRALHFPNTLIAF